MTDFDQTFEKVQWGWRMQGHADATSPVTVWQCAGGSHQVNVAGEWCHSNHASLQQAQMEAMNVVHGILDT